MQGELFGGVCLSGCVAVDVVTQGGRKLCLQKDTQSCGMLLHGVACESRQVRLPAGRNESLFGQHSLCVTYRGPYLWTYLITVAVSHIFYNWELLYYITRKK